MIRKFILSSLVASGMVLVSSTDSQAGPIRRVAQAVANAVHNKHCGGCGKATKTTSTGSCQSGCTTQTPVNTTVYSGNVGTSTVGSSCANGKCPLVPTTGLVFPKK